MIVSSFIIQANVITIINYDRKTFIVQATDKKTLLFFSADHSISRQGLETVYNLDPYKGLTHVGSRLACHY
jgi:hypothetical protein